MTAPASPTGSTQPKMMSSTCAGVETVAVAQGFQHLRAEAHGRHLVQRAVLLAAPARRAHGVVDISVGHFVLLRIPAMAGGVRLPKPQRLRAISSFMISLVPP